MSGDRIKEVKARQVPDFKGRPVVEIKIYTGNGKMGGAGISTGMPTGKNESYVLRDNDEELFDGLSVFEAVKNIEEIISPVLVSMDVADQQAVDHRIIELDGIGYKTNLGGSIIYSVSCATARVAVASVGKPLWRCLAEEGPKGIFAPAYNTINGGTYGNYTPAFQEFTVIPRDAGIFYEGPRIEVEIFQKMGDIIRRYSNGKPSVMGNCSGYDAPSDDPSALLDMFMEAASSSGCEDKVIFSMDCAAGEIYDEARDTYLCKGTYIDRDEMISLFSRTAHKHPIGFIEGALQEEDLEGFKKAGREIQAVLIGDDSICSNIDRTKKAIDMDTVQGTILEPNQTGILTEAIEMVRFMKQHDLLVVTSGRAEGVIDDLNAGLAIALGLPIMKTRTPRGGERAIFANTGLRVEEQLKPEKAMADVLKVPGFERLE